MIPQEDINYIFTQILKEKVYLANALLAECTECYLLKDKLISTCSVLSR